MDEKYIVENDIAAKYLRGYLTPEETVEFEVYFMDKPELLKQLETDTVLFKELPKIFNAKKERKAKGSWLLSSAWRASFTTFVVCILGFQLIYHDSNDGANQDEVYGASANDQLKYIEPTRSLASDVNIVELEFEPYQKRVTFVLEPTDINATEFEIIITERHTGTSIWHFETVVLTKRNELNFSVAKKLIPKEKYAIKVISLNGNNIGKFDLIYLNIKHL